MNSGRRIIVVRAIAVVASLACLVSCSTAKDIADGADDPNTPSSQTPDSIEPSTSTPPPRADLSPRPRVGNCYKTTRLEFESQRDGSAAVPCSARHTAETFRVIEVGGDASSTQFQKAWRDCDATFKRYVGDGPTVSKIGVAVLRPTAKQLAEGQGWLRCDAIDRASFSGVVGRPVTGTVRGLLDKGVPGRFRGCVKHWPKVSQQVHFTPCAQAHQAELIPQSISLGGPEDPYPGRKVVARQSKSFCDGVFQDYVPETTHYYYYYPTLSSWYFGTHDTTCWALDVNGDGLPPI